LSSSKRNCAAASGSDTELSKDQKLAASEAEIVRLQTALNAKPSSPVERVIHHYHTSFYIVAHARD